MNGTDNRLRPEFLRRITEGSVSTEKLRHAVSIIAPHFHLCGMEAELIGDFTLPSGEREIMLYENPDAFPADEPLKFTWQLTSRRSVVIYLYPGDRAFTAEEMNELESYAAECMLYLHRILADRTVRQSATTQYMTALPNESGYINRILQMMKKNIPLTDYSAFYFNLRNFGEINRRYGRETGDVLLRQYADSVREFVGDDGIVGHIGSDNFVVLILTARQEALIRYLSDVRPTPADDELRISAAMGVWDISGEVTDPGVIIDRPAIACNQAKNVLHQSVAFVTDAMLQRVGQQRAVLENYERALENEEFLVYYQPKVDSLTGELVGAEGLVRWIHDGDLIISPGIFIPALEESGNTLPLDYYVLRRACADIRRWIIEGLTPVTVSVNFSRKDLKDRRLAENICRIIEEYGIDKNLIEIELTETVDDEEHGVLIDFINKLHDLGIMTAIDDFGSGYSSLSTLREFQVHTLKIDRSFVNSDDFSWRDEIILRDIIHMAKELGMEVLTEGVERDDQLAFVNSVGCSVIQGYYYDKPLPRAEFEDRLQERFYKK